MMKLSNKILIGFFSIALLYMLAAFTEIRLKGYLRNLEGENVKVEGVPVSEVGYVALSNIGPHVNISPSDTPRIEVRSFDGNLLAGLTYRMTGDTLNLEGMTVAEDVPVEIDVYTGKRPLRGLQAEGGSVRVSHLEQASMNLTLHSTYLSMSDGNRVGSVSVHATGKANMDAGGLDVDSLSVQLDDSRVFVWSALKLLDGAMANKSNLLIRGVSHIRFSKDESSKMQIMD